MSSTTDGSLAAAQACEQLASVGLRLAPTEVEIERRYDRWLVRLPGARLAWIAASEAGVLRLASERRVLRLLALRCTFAVPRPLLESDDGTIDVRAMVPGASEPWRMYEALQHDVALAEQIGAAVGAMLAEQHTAITAADVDWLPRTPKWPASRAWVTERVANVVDDAGLLADIDAVMAAYERVAVTDDDRALVHTDLGLHNLAIDPDTRAVCGVFDYDDAAWADRHHDFRYLLFDFDRRDLLDAARSVYEPAVGRNISVERVALYNAACAVMFLAHRVGTSPDDRPCGRTLAEDLRWSTEAIARLR